MSAVPEVGERIVASMRSVVVFSPRHSGPKKPDTRPGAQEKDTSRTAGNVAFLPVVECLTRD